ncbi:MAG: hypothetical protein KA518_01715 [Acinetobacter sp.]|nr:hypothetical protein [Acinetobacter sp.]
MSHFKLQPLTLALLAVTSTSVIANTAESEVKNAQQLSTIVVSAAGYEQKIKDAPASITVLDQEE